MGVPMGRGRVGSGGPVLVREGGGGGGMKANSSVGTCVDGWGPGPAG